MKNAPKFRTSVRRSAARKATPIATRPAAPATAIDDGEALTLLAIGAHVSNPLAHATERFLGAAMRGDLDLSPAGAQAADHLELLATQALDLGVLAHLEIIRRSIEEVGRPGTSLATALELTLKFAMTAVQARV